MKVTTIDKHLIQLTQYGAVNCYLIREADGFTLVDTCYRGFHRFILEFATTAKIPIPRKRMINCNVIPSSGPVAIG